MRRWAIYWRSVVTWPSGWDVAGFDAEGIGGDEVARDPGGCAAFQ